MSTRFTFVNTLKLSFVVLLTVQNVWASTYSGTSSFDFLNIPTGARATGMGEAFTSVPNDIQGLAYNPASLATLAASQVSFQGIQYVSDINEGGVAFGHAGRDQGLSWGLLSNYLDSGSIDRTVATQQATGDGFTTDGSFSTYDMMIGGSVAGPVFVDGFSMGTTVKFLHESLSDASSSAAAFDLGAVYQGNVERSWNIGASLQNVGVASKFADAAVKLPLTGRVGFSGQPFAQWLFSGDYVKRQDTGGEFDIGAEVTPRKFISLRSGYRYSLTNPDLGGLSNFSIGASIRWSTYSLDYAFIPLGDLGITNRVSFNMRFKTHRD